MDAQVTEQMVDAAHRQVPGVANRVRVRAAIEAALAAGDPYITDQGIDGPGITEPTGQPQITVNEPKVLAGISEISGHLMVGRSTVAGWINHAETNGMPAPIAILRAGPVFDLAAVTTWHTAWKASA